MRLDKWLFAARFYKTRALAVKAIKQGKITCQGQKPNPSREVKIGMILTLKQGEINKTIAVEGLSEQRQSAPIAQTLYTETQESIEARAKQQDAFQQQKLVRQTAPRPPKRPEKEARRLLRKMRRQDST